MLLIVNCYQSLQHVFDFSEDLVEIRDISIIGKAERVAVHATIEKKTCQIRSGAGHIANFVIST
jgi:hypothetical protein